MSHQNKDVLRRFFKALGGGDIEGLKAVMAPDITAIAMGTDLMGGSRGYDEILGAAGMLGQIAPKGIDFQVVSMTAEEDRVSAEVQGRSTLVNGQPYDNRYHFLATIRDGKIVLLKEYMCTKMVEDVLGPLIRGAA